MAANGCGFLDAACQERARKRESSRTEVSEKLNHQRWRPRRERASAAAARHRSSSLFLQRPGSSFLPHLLVERGNARRGRDRKAKRWQDEEEEGEEERTYRDSAAFEERVEEVRVTLIASFFFRRRRSERAVTPATFPFSSFPLSSHSLFFSWRRKPQKAASCSCCPP